MAVYSFDIRLTSRMGPGSQPVPPAAPGLVCSGTRAGIHHILTPNSQMSTLEFIAAICKQRGYLFETACQVRSPISQSAPPRSHYFADVVCLGIGGLSYS